MITATVAKRCVTTGGEKINSQLAGVWEVFWKKTAYKLGPVE